MTFIALIVGKFNVILGGAVRVASIATVEMGIMFSFLLSEVIEGELTLYSGMRCREDQPNFAMGFLIAIWRYHFEQSFERVVLVVQSKQKTDERTWYIWKPIISCETRETYQFSESSLKEVTARCHNRFQT
uniref:Uncharacterized protein n=1 Tax=Trichogramma kaykai TaxID=54128 RepID=A0ABD2X4U3_9HYME